MVNRLKEKLSRGEPVIGHWLSLPCPAIAELLASYGMDWLLVDTEHGAHDYETVENHLRAMLGTDVTPLVRVAENNPAVIKRALDRGAMGVLIPLINSVEDAQNAVAACKYPPMGIRGIAGMRVNRFGGDLPAYFRDWNDQGFVGVQIETREALENVEKIAQVPGIDLLFLGPNDLSAALGVFQQFDALVFKDATRRILKAANDNGIAAGYMCGSADGVLQKIDEGFRFIAVGTDARLIASAASATYGAIWQGLESRKK